jgi:hypothetical protein
VYRLGAAVGALFAVVRRGLESWADLAAVWEARQRVAKLHVCGRGSRAREVAARKAAGAVVADLMANGWCGITSERRIQESPEGVSSLPAAVPIAQCGEDTRLIGRQALC